MTAFFGRVFGPGLMLLVFQCVSLLAVGLEVGYFHLRVALLLEPLSPACGGDDAYERMRVAEHLLARANALDDWDPLAWVPATTLLLALTGALAASVEQWRRSSPACRVSAGRLVALQVGALALGGTMLHAFDRVWQAYITLLPAACMTDALVREDASLAASMGWTFQVFDAARVMPPHAPDVMAIVLIGQLLASLAVGIWLWRQPAASLVA